MNIILIGPPGSGKGTQAQKICEKYNLKYISTGNLIREEIAAKTALGVQIKAVIESGKLVDDKTVLEMVDKLLKSIKTGVLLDGFPRTLAQADALDKILPISAVIDIEVSDTQVVKRISSRWMAKSQEQQYTFVNKELAFDFVKKNGGQAFQRQDDKESVVLDRLKVYHSQTKPLVSYYEKKNLIFLIDGEKSIDAVFEDITAILDKKRQS